MGLSIAREQDGAAQGKDLMRTKKAVAMVPADSGRRAAMEVAVANSMLDQGQAREALSIYKDTLRGAYEQAERVSGAVESYIEKKDWKTETLIRSEFSPKEREEVIKELVSRGSAWLSEGNYDRAVETFEKVFILDPLNVKASKGIDRARKFLIKRNRAEQELLEKIEN